VTRSFKDPGWWQFGAILLTLVCQAFAFQKLTERDLARIQQSLERMETRMVEYDRRTTQQNERIIRLEAERDLERSIGGMARENGRPSSIRPPYRAGGKP
jgi:hypothetical protein